jgi:gamma-glutamyltranspeptidase
VIAAAASRSIPLPDRFAGQAMIEGNQVISSRRALAAHPMEAARIGARMLEAGGNATDALAAAGVAQGPNPAPKHAGAEPRPTLEGTLARLPL